MKQRIILLPLTLLLLSPCMSEAQTAPGGFRGTYPVTKTVSQSDDFFGTSVADPYRWLEDDRSAATGEWVKQQNAVTGAYLGQIPFRKAIKDRLAQLWNYEKYGVPFREGEYLYFYKNDGLQNQAVLYRQKGSGKAQVFLDPNKFSSDGTVSLSSVVFNEEGWLAAAQTSDGGSDWADLFVIDARTNTRAGDTLRNLKFSSIAWKGSDGFYYSTYDKPLEGSQLSGKTDQHKLLYHKMGTPQSDDQFVFGGDQMMRRYIGANITEGGRFLVVSAANATYGNELYIQDLTRANGALQPVLTGFANEHEVIAEDNGMLYILTNMGAPNRKLVVCPADNVDPKTWRTVIPEKNFPLTVSACGDHFFAQYVKDAVSQVFEYTRDGQQLREIVLPGLGTASGFGGKKSDKETFYSFTSYTYPTTIFRYDLNTGQSSVYKKPAVKADPSLYESKQVFYPSSDGTVIPMIITHKKGLKLDGKNPTMLYGYGGFSISLTPSFSVSNLTFMEAGGVYAVANLRGGGEYGDQWHDQGTKQQKQNVFNDFIAAAEYLIAEKYTSKERLAISGGSNGGLLVGATMTQRPDLVRVAFPAVGVLDMLRYHKFTAGAGWAYDYGTADDDQAMFKYLYGYSPVHNVKKGTCYPATMVMTGDHDDRVVPAHSFKFAAALQAAQSCANPTLIRIETRAGHGAGKPTALLIEEQADKWAFLLWNMGLTYKKP